MRTYQKFMCLGRMGKDPESVQVGTSVKANLSVATSKSHQDASGNWVEETDWHSVELWNDLAVRVLSDVGPKKGDIVLIEGEVRYRQYQGQDGTTKYATNIRGFVCSIMERSQKAPSQDQFQQAQQPQQQAQPQQQFQQPQQQQTYQQPANPQYQQQQQYSSQAAPNFNNTPAQPARQQQQQQQWQPSQPQQAQPDYSQDLPF